MISQVSYSDKDLEWTSIMLSEFLSFVEVGWYIVSCIQVEVHMIISFIRLWEMMMVVVVFYNDISQALTHLSIVVVSKISNEDLFHQFLGLL